MTRTRTIAIVFVLPLVVVAVLVALALVVPLPGQGRDYVLRIALPRAGQPLDLPPIEGPRDRSRPLVVIDPGHGGHDPGALAGGVREKDVTLALALALRDALLEQGGVRVALTRSDDTFLTLAERPELARRMQADLFVSLHADTAGEADEVTGASIYTLSNEASSEAAARFAARENDAGAINGVTIEGRSDDVELDPRRTVAASLAGARERTGAADGARGGRDDRVPSAAAPQRFARRAARARRSRGAGRGGLPQLARRCRPVDHARRARALRRSARPRGSASISQAADGAALESTAFSFWRKTGCA